MRKKHIKSRDSKGFEPASVSKGFDPASAKEHGLLEGRLVVIRSGDAFLIPDSGEGDVWISRSNLRGASNGDRVFVKVDAGGHGGSRTRPGRGAPGRRMHRDLEDPAAETTREKRGPGKAAGRASGVVVKVIKRLRDTVVGTLRRQQGSQVVVPMDASATPMSVAGGHQARPGDRVVVELPPVGGREQGQKGRIIEVIGPVDAPSLDTTAILRHYGYSRSFPDAVRDEAEAVAAFVDAPGSRVDLRDKFIFTIDPAEARDFDDALSLETDSAGNRVLGVHIADVSHFVRHGSVLDKEARRRGNSVYFPDTVIPMLPKRLSNGVCSLVPGEDRLTFSVFITVDENAKPLSARFARTIIRSGLRLTYQQAMAALETPAGAAFESVGMNADSVRLLKSIGHLAQQFRKRRFEQYALELDVPECDVLVAPDGEVTDIVTVENDPSHKLIEECMVAANEAVDVELSRRGILLVHRIHEPPATAKIEDLINVMLRMGFRPGDLHQRRNLAHFLRSVDGTPMQRFVRTTVLRSMKKAVYSSLAKGHYGLAKKHYTHFTSPIRRYPDLVVHRLLGAALAGRQTPYGRQELDFISLGCSATEQMGEEAERRLLEIKKYRFLEKELSSGNPQPRQAVVVSITGFGMFVELLDLQVQGLVHASTMRRGGARRGSRRGGRAGGGKAARVGDTVEVIVARVDADRRQVDFALCDPSG